LLDFFGIFLIFSEFWFAVLEFFGCFLVFGRSCPLSRVDWWGVLVELLAYKTTNLLKLKVIACMRAEN
jgi:hypothetical protein